MPSLWDTQQDAAERQVNLPSSEHFQVWQPCPQLYPVVSLAFLIYDNGLPKKTHKYNALA